MSSSEQTRTTVAVAGTTLERLKDLKPYESATMDEFINVLADTYEETDTLSRGR